jgi:membrane protein
VTEQRDEMTKRSQRMIDTRVMSERRQMERLWTRSRPLLRSAWQLVSETLDGFSKDRGDLMAAALAYYTLLSIAPLILIAVAIAGTVLGQGAAQQEVARLLTDAMGSTAASAVEGWVQQAAAGGGVASVVGLGLVLLAASGLGTQLRNALNQIWNVDVTGPRGFRLIALDYVKKRAFAFLVVLASGPLLLLVFASRALLTGFHPVLFAASPWSGVIVQGLQLVLSVSLVASMSAAIFRFVPDLRVSWRSASWGGVLTSLLFNLGNVVVGLYLGRARVGAAYGAAGSVVVVLLWLQFSAYMFLLGAEFTQRLHQRSTPEGEPKRESPPPSGGGEHEIEAARAPSTGPIHADRLEPGTHGAPPQGLRWPER